MKNSTINKFINHCKQVQELGITYSQYEDKVLSAKGYFAATMYRLKQEPESELVNEAINLYNSNKYNNKKTEKLDNEQGSEIYYTRNDDGKIVTYHYKVYRKNKEPLVGSFDRNEMNTVYRLYSYYGDSLQQRIVSRQFPELSLIDFKRVLRAFQITKASSPFAPHMYEEHTEDELLEIQGREKENSFLRKAEEQRIKTNEKLLNKYALENTELKKQLDKLSKFEITIPSKIDPIYISENNINSNNNLILHLSDMHIGATVTTGSLYTENINYGTSEIQRRLLAVIAKIKQLPSIDTIVINLLGDNIDCCGIDGRTARLDHEIPENMDAREQANTYIRIMHWFIGQLVHNKCCNKIKIYAVPCGNHGGNFEYMTNIALLESIKAVYPDVQTTMFDQFFGFYTFSNHKWVICHGKDSQYMKKGLPLNCDDKTKIMLYEWFNSNGIPQDNVHVIKGDLHSNNLNSCKEFDYRNVLSLFGASDYCSYNFSKNSYGISYELLIGDTLLRGTFENM